MERTLSAPIIPESFLEHRQKFPDPWVESWIIPNPFITAIYNRLRGEGVELSDFSFKKDPENLGETSLKVAIRNLNAEARIGLDTITFGVANPDWESASKLAGVFGQVAEAIRGIVGAHPVFQETTLALHVRAGKTDLKVATAALVNAALLGESTFYGISLHRDTGTITIDKSVRHVDAAFIRFQRQFGGEESFAVIASKLFEDEVFALGLLGLLDSSKESR